MDYTIESVHERKVIQVVISGLFEMDHIKDMLLLLACRIQAHAISNVIIDVTNTHHDDTEPMNVALELINHMRMIGIDRATRFALVYREMIPQREHFENAAMIDGWRLKYFGRHADAFHWLAAASS